ncbi:MAG: type II secretion system protein GspN [Polyangiaceae bacterium]|nr:type II secretion system protein GspN [Polyangiaceae bacterium]
MKRVLWKIAKWTFYPVFYLVCLVFFAYLTFPFGKVKDRILAEFARSEATAARKPGSAGPMRLEIGELSGHLLSGVEVKDVRLHIPRKHKTAAKALEAAATDEPKESVVTLERGTLRVRILPLLAGRVRIDYDLQAFDGRLHGTFPYGGSSGDLLAELEHLDLSTVEPLAALLPVPLSGLGHGKVVLSPKEGKFSKAEGTVDLKVDDIVVGDGKAKVEGIALPPARIGTLSLTATAKEGVLTIDEFAAQGGDVEIIGEGKITIREPWNRSQLDLSLRFRFTDGYRDRDDTTRSLLGKPGDSFPPALEVGSPDMKRAKRDDGFYGFRVTGTLADPKFQPQGSAPARPAKPGLGPSSKRGRTNPKSADEEGGAAAGAAPAPTGTSPTGRPSIANKLPRPSFPGRSEAAGQPPTGAAPPEEAPPAAPALPPPEEPQPPTGAAPPEEAPPTAPAPVEGKGDAPE